MKNQEIKTDKTIEQLLMEYEKAFDIYLAIEAVYKTMEGVYIEALTSCADAKKRYEDAKQAYEVAKNPPKICDI